MAKRKKKNNRLTLEAFNSLNKEFIVYKGKYLYYTYFFKINGITSRLTVDSIGILKEGSIKDIELDSKLIELLRDKYNNLKNNII